MMWIFSFSVFISIFLGGSCYLLKAQIPRLFTDDPAVYNYTTPMMPILALFLLFEGFGVSAYSIINFLRFQT